MAAMSEYLPFRPPRRLQLTVSLSPDGSTVAYADDRTGQFNLVVQPVDGQDARTLTSFAEHTVRRIDWHPNGQRLAFLADRHGTENSRLYVIEADGSRQQDLSTRAVRHWAAIGNPFSPDGSTLAFSANDRGADTQDVLLRSLQTGTVTRLFERDRGGQVYAGHWSPDGGRLSITEWVDAFSDHVVYVADVMNGEVRRLTFNADPTAVYWLGPWLPDGNGFLVCTNAGHGFEGLAVLDATTGDLTWVDASDWDVERVDASADGRTVAWTVNVDGASQLKARDMTTGTDLEVPRLPLGAANRLSVANDGKSAVLLMSTPTMPANILRVDLAGRELHWITDIQPEALATRTFPAPILTRFPSRLGDSVPAYTYMPENPPERVGVLISVHGGPDTQERPNYPYGGLYPYLQDQGIAVFSPNNHGSTGYGSAYQARIYKDWGGVDLDDIDAAVDYLLEQPWVDPNRIGLFGGSYGGFVVLSAISRLPHRKFAAAAVYFGPSNLVTFARAMPPTWRTLVERVIGDPVQDYDFLMDRSPVTYADNITAPLLLLQGANDPRVPASESDQIVERLRALGREVDYRVFPDEGHGFMKTSNEITARTLTAEFLTRYLRS
jgi:dipeptidyl aminopeptidase/acylaminoacyl peptidase